MWYIGLLTTDSGTDGFEVFYSKRTPRAEDFPRYYDVLKFPARTKAGAYWNLWTYRLKSKIRNWRH